MRYWGLPGGGRRWRWLLCLAGLMCSLAWAEVPDFAQVKAGFQSSYAVLEDRNGLPLHARRIDMQTNRLSWVELRDVSPALPEALVFAEDRDFYRHHGVDWWATLRATFNYLHGDKSRGASTITMQLAALLDQELSWRRGGRSLDQKWDQIEAARELERHWTKAQILEAYINLTQFRGDLQGVAAVSHALYGKDPIALTRPESLLLAAMLPAPAAPAPRIAQRACTLIAAGFPDTDCQTVKDVALTRLNKRLSPIPERPALEALSARLLKTPGEELRSSLDGRIQREAEEALASQLADIRNRHVDAGAVLVLDNQSGEVLAYVGNGGAEADTRFVDSVQALRQAGSTLKPFLYELAIEKKYLTAASVLEDSPISLATPNGLYVPQNYEKDFKGPVTARTALGGSLNVPAVRVLTMVGVDALWQRLHDVGFQSLTESPDFYGFSLALGSGDVSLWELVNGYRTLANGGLYSAPVYGVGAGAAAQRILDPAAVFVVGDMLSDRQARAVTFGWESPLATPFWTAVKTGTSKDMRDNWCIGFSQRYTVGVWVGNMEGSPMHDVSGITGAAPVWLQVMRFLEGGQVRLSDFSPQPPPGLEHQTVRFEGLGEPARAEWFLAGTEMDKVVYAPDSSVRIVYPVNETLVAIDPDIPEDSQRLRFHAETREQKLDWWLDGKRLGVAADYDWLPTPGAHRLSLRDRHGRQLDDVRFTVRGQFH